MNKPVIYRWFVEPIGTYSSEAIIKFIASREMDPEVHEADDREGAKPNLYELNKRDLRYLAASRSTDSRLKFNIYCEQGGGVKEQVNFLYTTGEYQQPRRRQSKPNGGKKAA